jgi:KaiC/GvpD/RAD55 family RecA-like ATPase
MNSIKMARVSRAGDNHMQIPPDLMHFVQHDTYSLLIKGNSGTGKTTLSLTILKALEVRSNFFYISTRLSPRQLFVNYPWLDKFVVRENIEVNDLTNQRTSLSSFEDARLDEPESLFERITNQLMDVKAPIIIIDSWDAIASFMDTEARLNNERVLQTWRERAGAKLIFTSEDAEDNTLDFLVDGIVELKQSAYRTTGVRQIILSKLRGIKINRSSYIFTLNNGIFQSYKHYDPSDFLIVNPATNAVASRNRVEQKESSLGLKSSSKIAKKFTGIECESLRIQLSTQALKNRLVLLEVDQVISPNVCISFLAKIMSQFINNDDSVIIQPSSDTEPKVLLNYLQPYVYQKLGKNLRIFHHMSKDPEISEFIVEYRFEDTFSERFKKFQNIVSNVRSQHKNTLLLNLVMLEDLGERLNEDSRFSEIISYLKLNTNLSVLVSIGPNKHKEIIRKVDIYLKLKILSDTLFLQSVIPSGHCHAVLVQRSLGVPRIRLDCLV